jgi:hypothetical protein
MKFFGVRLIDDDRNEDQAQEEPGLPGKYSMNGCQFDCEKR